MLKRLKTFVYNKKTAKNLMGVEFNNFTIHGKLPYPIFFQKVEDRTIQRPFIPESEEMFKLAVEKINEQFFKNISLDDFKNMVRKYCNFFHFNESTINSCVEIYHQKANECSL